MRRILSSLLFLIMSLSLAAQETMNDYRVSITPADAEAWTDLVTYRCDVDMHKVQQASFALFDMARPTMVRVVSRRLAQGERVTEAIVRPLSKHITPDIVNDSTVVFTLAEPAYLSIELNGDRKHNLHLVADAPLAETYTGNEPRCINWDSGEGNNHDVFIRHPRLIYFGPGVHKVKDIVMGEETGEVKIPSNCTVYLAPGAVVLGKLVVSRARNVRIVGRGMLLHPQRGIEITYSRNVLVDGITVVNPRHYTVFGGQASPSATSSPSRVTAGATASTSCAAAMSPSTMFSSATPTTASPSTTIAGGSGVARKTFASPAPPSGPPSHIPSALVCMAMTAAKKARCCQRYAYRIVTY